MTENTQIVAPKRNKMTSKIAKSALKWLGFDI